MADEPCAKRPRLAMNHAEELRAKRSAFLSSLSRSVSPPRSTPREALEQANGRRDPTIAVSKATLTTSVNMDTKFEQDVRGQTDLDPKRLIVRSPFQLTRVRGLPSKDNVDTVSLHDILGDPLIKQAWIFNFCFNVNWTMQHFDADVRQLIDVKIIHGSWRKEDGNRKQIEEDLKLWKNVQEIRAYLPDQFGTHHSKMIILFKHDDTAQVVVHTANMLEKDWDHMTQAVWQSPVLPVLSTAQFQQDSPGTYGKGTRFKHDLLRYLMAYGSKLKPLVDQLGLYDFSAVRAALVASVPSHAKVSDIPDKKWGHLALANVLQTITPKQNVESQRHLACQVSSIATLPASWLSDTIYKAASSSPVTHSQSPSAPSNSRHVTTSIIYPTPADLRGALTGYATGGSVHTKIASAAQLKQVSLLRPHLHRWGIQSPNHSTRAGRHSIPPHIKTYICYVSKPTADSPTPDIEWTLVTSANLSTQAWGTAPKLAKGARDAGEAVVHIQSFEIGVLVWPQLFQEEVGELSSKTIVVKSRMIATFGKDTPDLPQISGAADADEMVVGMRMPYDLPLTAYATDEMPWSPSAMYNEPDRLGNVWPI